MLEIGDTANNITLKGLTKENHMANISLSDFQGKNVILFFYSMEKALNAPEKTKQFGDTFNVLNDAVILLVNKDSLENQIQLKKLSEFSNFIFLTDPNGRAAKIFDTENDNTLSSTSSLFLLNGDLKIINLWKQQEHMGNIADEIYNYIKQKTYN